MCDSRAKRDGLTVPLHALFLAALLSPFASAATLTWDPDGDSISNGGAGDWDTGATANWGGGVTTWTAFDSANFGDAGAAYNVFVANNTAVTDITVAPGTGRVSLQAAVDNNFLEVNSAGATWDTGGRELEIFNNNVDLRLRMTGGVLTVIGGGFDTGERPNGAAWDVGNATLDFQANVLRGTPDSVGRFSSVKMAGGSTYFQERNTPNQNYTNDWELDGSVGTGIVTFDNRFSRPYLLTGAISGTGTLRVANLGGQRIDVRNPNTYSGGTIVASTANRAELNITNDNQLGAVPGSFDADNIRLVDNGELKMQGVTINANRGITLDGGGILVNTNAVNTYGGTIIGAGGLQIGRSQGGDGNILVLNSDTHDYIGGTRLFQGGIRLGIDNALPNNQSLTIGGVGTSQFQMNGFDQTVAGLQSVANNTRLVVNNSASVSTLTIDVADGDSFNYGANITGSGSVAIVKNGLGTQVFNRGGNFGAAPASVTVNEGTLRLDGNGFSTMTGAFDVVGGTLDGAGSIGGLLSVGAGTITPGASPGTITALDGMSLDAASILDFEFEGADLTVGGGVNDLIDVTGDLVLDGTLDVTELTAGGFLSASIGDAWRVINYTGLLTNNGLQLGATPSLSTGLYFRVDTSTAGEVNLVVAEIPEPAAATLLALVFGVVGVRRARAN